MCPIRTHFKIKNATKYATKYGTDKTKTTCYNDKIEKRKY